MYRFLSRTTVYYSTVFSYPQSFRTKKYACIPRKTSTFKDIFHKKTMIQFLGPNHRFIRFSEL